MTPRKAVLGTMILALTLTGCPITPSQGVDLSVRGVLSLLISQESGSATASAGASVRDNQAILTLLQLADDQVLSVSGVELHLTLVALLFGLGLENTQVVAEIGAVEAPESYTVSFDDQGQTTSMTVTPPANFTSATPAAGSQVSSAGFNVSWSPSGVAGVLVDIVIQGLQADEDDEDTEPDTKYVTLSNFSDDGTATVGASDLEELLPGVITVTVKRFHTYPQSLGFASGNVRVEVFYEIALTLTDRLPLPTGSTRGPTAASPYETAALALPGERKQEGRRTCHPPAF